jgi:steroid delta-isomerase-like uncharacterized protein
MKTKFSAVCLAVLFLFMVSTQGCAQKPKLDLKKIADNIIKTLNSADPVAVTNLYAQDAVMIQPSEPAPVRGHDALLKSYEAMFKAMPDWKVDLSVVAISTDTIVFEGVGGGTFTGPLVTPEGEVAPTGKKASLKLVFLAKISPDGLIAEDRTYFDNMEYMKQMGLLK